MAHNRWIGSTEAGRLLETSPQTAFKILRQAGVPTRQLAPGLKYQGRIQFPENEVRKVASHLNGFKSE